MTCLGLLILVSSFFSNLVKRLRAHPAWLLMIYPTWFMWPCLLPGTSSMLQYSAILDTSGTVAIAQMLQKMPYPWSTNFMQNAPLGESFWSPPMLTQSVHWLFFWLETRFMSPLLAVNVFIWIGWVLSGIAGYTLARYLKMSMFSALFVGLLIEVLPWVREKAMTHVAYVYLCIPLFTVLLTLKVLDSRSKRNLFHLAVFICALTMFDLYWFFMCISLVFVIAIVHYKLAISYWVGLARRTKRLVAVGCLIAIFCVRWVYNTLVSATSSATSLNRGLSVADNSFIDLYNGSLLRFIRPTIGHVFVREGWLSIPPISEDFVTYGGITVLVLASCSVLFAKRASFSRYPHFVGLYVVALLLALLTLPTTLDTPLGEFAGPVSYLKYITPGMRVYSRFGLITEALLCVVAGFVVDWILRLDLRIIFRTALVVVIALVCLIDMSPLSRRAISSDFKEYAGIREALNEDKHAVVYVLVPDLDKYYFPAHYVDAPRKYTPLDRFWNQGFDLQASRGEKYFASYLRSKDVTHVMVPAVGDQFGGFHKKWGNFGSIDLAFDPADFTEVASANGLHSAKLFKIEPGNSRNFCSRCLPYRLNWAGVRESFYSQLYVNNQQVYEDGPEISWVLPDENPQVTLVSDSPVGTKFEMTFGLIPAYGGQAQPQIVRFDIGSRNELVRLMPGGPTKYSVVVESGQLVSLKRFLPCTVPAYHEPGNPDMRAICYAISSLQVKQVVP